MPSAVPAPPPSPPAARPSFDEIDDASRFVLEIGRALHRFGTPAHRLEQAMSTIAASLQLHGEFFATPTGLMVTLRRDTGERTSLLRIEATEIHLEKLTLIDKLASEVAGGRLSPADGLERLEAIVAAPPRYGAVLSVASYGLSAAGGACFFGGGPREALAGGAVGVLIGILARLMPRSRGSARIFELVAAAVTSLAAAWLGHRFAVSSPVVALAALMVLLPGFTLTVAMTELATGHLVSGTARVMGAVIIFLQLGLGVALGERLVAALLTGGPTMLVAQSLPVWVELLALAATAAALTTVVQGQPVDVVAIFVGCNLAFWGARAGAWLLGPELGVLVGALMLGVGSNLYARIWQRPAVIPIVPALFLLVPGSVGFRGVSSLLRNDTLAGVDTTFSMFMIASAIVAGLLMANTLIPPRRAL